MPNPTPTDILDSFKKSGEYDRLRRELLTQFQKSEGIETFKSKIEENIRQLLVSDARLRLDVMSGSFTQNTQKLLVEQVERFPTVERAVSDHAMFSDPIFIANIRGFIEGEIAENKDEKKGTGKLVGTNPNKDSPLRPGVNRPSSPTYLNENVRTDADTNRTHGNSNSNPTSESPEEIGSSTLERSQSSSQSGAPPPPLPSVQPDNSKAKMDSEMECVTTSVPDIAMQDGPGREGQE
ncbi:hypothetical protein E1B28_004079 [Marasmius oreades]|uniref:BOD1/SHG1 domain-containing protein n=1 Tax=Marasmius oreades TaxID=181124 RepID=A0A9P7UXU8_9AGAR|nr:uncharacterized protein E1B28_004079 [Marasmius oreades]KAG7096664.1 hypothetical protein E1B28_004079 [Marasmius oreades]